MPAHVASASRPVRRYGPVSMVIGIIGELLITAGVVLGLFVVWQLWWTDIEANQQHAQIVAEVNESFEQPSVEQAAIPGEGDPPVAAQPLNAETFAFLYIPRFGTGYEEPISEGIDKKSILDVKGIGHYPDTQMPGELGNFAVAGHRTTYGKPFSEVADLQPGDAIIVRTADTWYVYKMTSTEIVDPEGYNVVFPIPGADSASVTPDNRYITLTSCHPKYSAKERFIVYGTLTYWAPTSSGIPQELLDAGVEVSTTPGADAAGGQ